MKEKLAVSAFAAIPPLLLIAVAGLQIHLVVADHLSPWKGGGFGMFSTSDIAANRMIRVYLRSGSHAIEVRPSDRHARLLDDAKILPSEARLERVARLVVQDEAHRGPVDSVRVEVWRRKFEADLDPHPVVLRQIEVPIE